MTRGRCADQWAEIKRRYNSLPRPLATLFALKIIARDEWGSLKGYLRGGNIKPWIQSWTGYARQSTRGMSKWYDWIDWIGGHPYERATLKQVADCYVKDGFRLSNLFDCSRGYGCNEFVFRRVAPTGTWVDSSIGIGTSVARCFGRRVVGPFERTGGMRIGCISDLPVLPTGAQLLLFPQQQLLLFRNKRLVGPAERRGNTVELVGAREVQTWRGRLPVFGARLPTVATRGAVCRTSAGTSGSWPAADLEVFADDAGNGTGASPVCILEDEECNFLGRILCTMISPESGQGRFCHWSRQVSSPR